MKYKIGDKVVIKKSLERTSKGVGVNGSMLSHKGKTMTIRKIIQSKEYGFLYYLEEDPGRWKWLEEFFIKPETQISW